MAETVYATSHLAGTFVNPTNAVGNTPATWAGELNTNTNVTSRWAIGNPVLPLTPAATQTINVSARKGSNSGVPTIALNLYENGVLDSSILAATNITSTTGQTLVATFNTSAITNRTDVEIEVVMTAATGNPSTRNSAQIAFIEWVAETSTAAIELESAPAGTSTVTAALSVVAPAVAHELAGTIAGVATVVGETTELGIITIVGTDFYLDGVILNEGSPAEGLLMNSRMVQTTVDFSAQSEVTNWDADANTAAFIAMLDDYKSFGLNSVVLNFQGGNFEAGWGESYDAGAWNADGSIRAAHAARMTDIIEACIANGVIPMVGLTYFRQDQILTNETAVLTMVESAKTFLAPWKQKVIIEVTNESENALVSHAILQEDRNHEIVDDLVAEGFFASASHRSGVVPTVAQQGDGQMLMLHGNGETLAGITTMVNSARSTFPGLPIVINEDGLITTTGGQAVARMNAAVDAGSGWGFHDPVGYQYWDGTNMSGMDWSINSALQNAVFDEFAVLTSDTPVFAGVPDEDISNAGGWDDPAGAVTTPNLFTLVNEGIDTPDDDTTRLRSPQGPTNATIEFGLVDVTDPVIHDFHVVYGRFRTASISGTPVHDITVSLYQGANLIAEDTFQYPGTTTAWSTVSVTLTSTEAGNITATGGLYTDLRIRLSVNQVSGTAGRLQVTALELRVPNIVALEGTPNGLTTVTGALTVEAGVVELAGTVTGTATVTGALTVEAGVVELAGTVTGTATVTGDITVITQLVATVTGQATISAELSSFSAQALLGSVQGQATVTGRLFGHSAVGRAAVSADLSVETISRLVASVSGVATVIGEVEARAELAVAPSGVAIVSGSLDVVTELAATSSGLGSVTANLSTFSDQDLSSTPAGVATVTGNLTLVRSLAASVSGLSTVTAALNTQALLETTLNGQSSVAADLDVQVEIEASTTGIGSVSGELDVTTQLASQALGTATVSGELVQVIQLESAISGTATVTAELSAIGVGEFGSSPAGQATVTAELTQVHEAASTIAGDSLVTAELTLAYQLESTASGVGSITGDLTQVNELATGSAGQSMVSGELSAIDTTVMATASSGLATVAGELELTNQLAATSSGLANVTAELTTVSESASTASGTSTVTASLSTISDLTAAPSGQATVSADLELAYQLEASISGEGTVTATLTLVGQVELTATSSGQATISGALFTIVDSAGTVVGSAIVSGTLQNVSGVSGSASGDSLVTGTLTLVYELSGDIMGVATVVADVNIPSTRGFLTISTALTSGLATSTAVVGSVTTTTSEIGTLVTSDS